MLEFVALQNLQTTLKLLPERIVVPSAGEA